MIVKCAHCQGLMRVDEAALPERESFMVRCPSCKGIGTIEAGDAKSWEDPHGIDPSGEIGGKQRPAAKSTLHAPAAHGEAFEPSIPDDAFEDFRFPAERTEDKENVRPRGRSKSRLVIFALISIAVVAFFALLVNLLLPGPSGKSIYKGAIPPDNNSVQSAPTSPGSGQ